MFEFHFLDDLKILRWRLRGFWSEADALRFQRALTTEMAIARGRAARFSALSDTRHFPVQTDAVMKVFAKMAQEPLAQGSRRFAILVSTTLNQLQAERSFTSARIRVFRDEPQALAWLAEASERTPAVTAQSATVY